MDLLARLAAIVGEESVVADPDAIIRYMQEPRGVYRGRALAVVKPTTVAEVSSFSLFAMRAGPGLFLRAATRGWLAAKRRTKRVVSLFCRCTKLNRVREIDPFRMP